MIKPIIVLFLFSQAAFSQLDTLWTKIYFPDDDTLDFIGRSLQPTLDGGFIILGEQNNENIEPEIFLLKADYDGDSLWTRILPYTTYEKVIGYSIDETPDGGLVVLSMESNYSCYDDMDSSSVSILVLFKLDSSGDTLWTRSYLQDYFHDQYEICGHRFEAIALQDGDLILYGNYYVDEALKTWLLKTNSLGEPIWDNTYDFNNTEGVTLGPDGSFFITGGYGFQGGPDTAYILKINPNGEQEWVQYESGPLDTKGSVIHTTNDNGIVVAGSYTDLEMNSTGPWLWKTDSLGNTEWDIYLGVEVGNLVQHLDGTYIIVGNSWGVYTYLLLNTNGDMSNSFSYEGFLYQAIDIKLLNQSTQITLVHNYLNKIGIVKSLYTNSSDCTADDGTVGVELWGECYSIEHTTELNISYIGLNGEIPPEIGNLINLSSLILKENQLSGEIIPEISYLTDLVQLDLGGNQLSGEIPPEIGYLTNLNILDLAGNQLTGSLPPEIGNLENLTELELGGNQVMGAIPPEIGNLENLTFVHLEYNQFTGEIPPEIGNLTNLVWLNFVHNQLIGEVPSSICNLNMNWSDPNNFNISENQLCPPYPECIEEYVGDQDTTNCHNAGENTVWYVSMDGNDENDGSEESPFATIQYGLDSAGGGDTVLVGLGGYIENIIWPSTPGIKLIGSGEDSCIIDGDSTGIVISFLGSVNGMIDTNTLIIGFTIQNGYSDGEKPGGGIYCSNASPMITECTIKENFSHGLDGYGGGIALVDSANMTILNVKIHNNDARGMRIPGMGYRYKGKGGGLFIVNSDPVFTNVEIMDNFAGEYGGGVYILHSSPIFTNFTISGNGGSGILQKGGGVLCEAGSYATFIGGSISDNGNSDVRWGAILGGGIAVGGTLLDSSSFHVELTDVVIQDNASRMVGGGVYGSHISLSGCSIIENSATYNGGGIYSDGEIDFSPTNRCNIYSNSVDSSDVGNDIAISTDYYGNVQTFLDVIVDTFTVTDPTDYYATPIDSFSFDILMGLESLETDPLVIPLAFVLYPNYPNPFNPETNIRYDLPQDAMVNITVFDMMGRVVSNLVSSQQKTGYKSVQWNATNNTGQPVSAGLYLYTIQAGELRKTKKMVLLK